MNNISSWLLCLLNVKGYYSQSYGKNNNILEIAILVDNFGGHNKNNLMIHFLNMIKEGVFFVEEHRSLGGSIISRLDNCAFIGLIYKLLVFS